MLSDLVKLAVSRKHKVKIDQGDINIDGKLYLLKQFHTVSIGFRPQHACCQEIVNGGMAFATEWSPLSNLDWVDFNYEGEWFNSTEQCFQYQKAISKGSENGRTTLITLTDPYDAKS